MVSIKGLSVKNIKYFKGHEQEDLVQCDVYFKGKKVGFYTQDSWGGCDALDTYGNKSEINEKGINELAQQYLQDMIKQGIADNFYAEHNEYYDFGSLIQEIISFNEYHKKYKKNIDKGFDLLAVCRLDNGYQERITGIKSIGLKVDLETSTKEQAEKLIKDKITYLFTSEEDFAIA